MSRFPFTRAFITGGSSGIGKATALGLAAAGASVVVSARGADRLDSAVAEIRAAADPSQHVSGITLDVADQRAVEVAGPAVIERLGGVDLVINNAGMAVAGYFENLSASLFREHIETNYLGAVSVTRAFVGHLTAAGRGHVSFVSSVAGFMGIFGYTAYAASKFALTGFADCLRQELAPRGIGVSVLFPPDTDTPQLAEENRTKPPETRAIAGRVAVVSPEYVARQYLAGIARGRYLILPGLDTRLAHFAHRHFPGLVRRVLSRAVRKAQESG